MKFLSRIKKLFIAAAVALIVAFSFIAIPVFANDGISKEVKQYKYEECDIFYSDAYFAHKSTEYDPHLATLSMLMTKFSMNPGGPKNLSDMDWFKNQSNRVKGFMEKIGFDSFEANDDYKSRTGFNTIGVAAAKRQVGDSTVIALMIRSGGYFLEWANNVYLGDGKKSDYMHEGWYNAALKATSFFSSYLKQYEIKGKVKLWMAGYSRGGAVTNLTIGLLDNHLNDLNNYLVYDGITLKHEDIYCYTFEAPQGANINSKTVKEAKDPIYNNIWNIVNPNDLVTKVAMSGYGFTRFGQDKFISTKFYNTSENRDTYKKINSLTYNNFNKYKADNLVMRGVTGDKIAGIVAAGIATGPVGAGLTGYIISKTAGLTSEDKTKANYDSNILSSIVLTELCTRMGSRDDYVRKYQDLTKDIMLSIMTEDNKEDKSNRIKGLILSLIIQSMAHSVGIKDKSIMKRLLPDYSNSDLGNVAALAGLFVSLYINRPNEIITLMMNMDEIFENHDTNVSLIHVEAQDDYYIKLYNDKHDDKAVLCPLLENAAIVHIAFYGYNDVQVYDENNKEVVNMDGKLLGKSKVKKCDPGFAVGYYSFITEEIMELYLPVNRTFKVKFKDYSKKLYHKVAYQTFCQYISASSKNQKLPGGEEKVWFNSDRKEITINVKP